MTPTPFQRLAAFRTNGNPSWERMAPILRRWADAQTSTAEAQADAICAHLVRVWTPVWLDLRPDLATHAEALRTAPCAVDWSETGRRVDAARATARATAWDNAEAARAAAWDAVMDAARAAAWAAAWDAVRDTARDTARAATLSTIMAAIMAAIPAARNHRDALAPARASASAEWIRLAEADAFAPLPSSLRAALDTDDLDVAAVAWDFLDARGLVDGGATDDGLRVRGYAQDGATIPAWARRTALIRSILRGASCSP